VEIGDRGSTVVKVLRYKSEGRWFDRRWCHGNFIDINPSDRTMAQCPHRLKQDPALFRLKLIHFLCEDWGPR
jgi:hypothetical protein